MASTSPSDGQTHHQQLRQDLHHPDQSPTTGIQGANVLTITASDGHFVSSPDVTVEGATLSTSADVDHPGKHAVVWHAVSANGDIRQGRGSHIPDRFRGPTWWLVAAGVVIVGKVGALIYRGRRRNKADNAA